MKKMMTFILCLVGIGAYACTGGERSITMDQLPAVARQFLMQHFDGVVVAHITEDTDMMSKSYDLWFVNGDKIEFAKDGTWTDVDCKYSSVPQAIIPMPIAGYLTKTYPAAMVKKIERDKKGCEVKLDNGMELKFNREYELVKIDD